MELKTLENISGELQSLRIQRGSAPRRKLSAWIIIAATLVGFLAAGFVYWRSRIVAPVVNVVLPQLVHNVSASPVLSASGYIVARREAVVSSKVQGRLAELNVGVGSQIQKGQIIARLESDDYEARLQSAIADVENAKAALAENQRQLRIADALAKDGIMSSDQRESVLSKVRSAEAALASANAARQLQQALLDDTVIRAPFSGTVVKKMSETGESVAPIPPGVNISVASGAIVALADFATLEMQADVSESEISKLRTGQPAEIQLSTVSQHKYHGFLRQLVPSADRTKGTVQVLVSITDKDSRLMPELNADVTFLEPPARKGPRASVPGGISVPRETIVQRGGRDVVFEVRRGQAWQTPVVTKGEDHGRVVITAGLTGSETLVLSPPSDLRDGSTVKISQP